MRSYFICLLFSIAFISCSRNYYLSKEDCSILDDNSFNAMKLDYFVDSMAYDEKRYILIGDTLHNKFFYVPKEYITKDLKEQELMKHGFPIVRFMYFIPGRNYYVNESINEPTVRYIGEPIKGGWKQLEFLVPPLVFKCYLVRGDEYLDRFCRNADMHFGAYKFLDKHAYYRVIVPIWVEHKGLGQLKSLK